MAIHKSNWLTLLAAAGLFSGSLVYAPPPRAMNFGDFMNPGKWMGGSGNRDDDWYEYGPESYGPPPGVLPYGAPYGAPYGMPYGFSPYGGGPGYGTPGYYGAPGWRPAAPAVTPPAATAPAAASRPPSSKNVKSAEIEALRRRIEELEAKQPAYTAPPPSDWGSRPAPGNWSASPAQPPGSGWGSAPAFRPMDKY